MSKAQIISHPQKISLYSDIVMFKILQHLLIFHPDQIYIVKLTENKPNRLYMLSTDWETLSW